MLTQTLQIDKQGRIELSRKILETLGLHPDSSVIVEVTDKGMFIKPKLTETPLSQEIADMGLPVSDCLQMKEEIRQGHFK